VDLFRNGSRAQKTIGLIAVFEYTTTFSLAGPFGMGNVSGAPATLNLRNWFNLVENSCTANRTEQI
jgi:hypothetical protein